MVGKQVNDPNLGAITPPPRATRNYDGVEPENTTPPGEASVTQMYEGDYGDMTFYTVPPDATPTVDPEVAQWLQEDLQGEGNN